MYKLLLLPILFLSLCIVVFTRMPSGYSDFYGRHKLWPMAQIFGNLSSPNHFDNLTQVNAYISECFNSSEFIKGLTINCDLFGNDSSVNCSSALVVSHDEEAIILTFRATVGWPEAYEQGNTVNITTTFPGGGTVQKYYYHAFLTVWNAGIRDAFLSLRNKYPTYEVWVTAWSMGSGLGANAAAYISQMGFASPDAIKLVTFGQMRVGYADFAVRYPSLVKYAYRVTHRHDHIPHGPTMSFGYFHIKNEIWYNNSMLEGDTFVECDDFESPYCANSVPLSEYNGGDHWYFNHTGLCKRTPNQ